MTVPVNARRYKLASNILNGGKRRTQTRVNAVRLRHKVTSVCGERDRGGLSLFPLFFPPSRPACPAPSTMTKLYPDQTNRGSSLPQGITIPAYMDILIARHA